jgi:para-nitrobenzyl esterase
VYQYEFSLPAIGTRATAHSAELPYVWGNEAVESSEGDRMVSAQMQQYWTNFAKTGDPNGTALRKWPRFESDKRRYVEFLPKGTVEKIDLRRAQCELLQGVGQGQRQVGAPVPEARRRKRLISPMS